jgi:hypothetical protein
MRTAALIPLPNHEALALLVAQIEFYGFGCLFVRCLNVTKVLGTGSEN